MFTDKISFCRKDGQSQTYNLHKQQNMSTVWYLCVGGYYKTKAITEVVLTGRKYGEELYTTNRILKLILIK